MCVHVSITICIYSNTRNCMCTHTDTLIYSVGSTFEPKRRNVTQTLEGSPTVTYLHKLNITMQIDATPRSLIAMYMYGQPTYSTGYDRSASIVDIPPLEINVNCAQLYNRMRS